MTRKDTTARERAIMIVQVRAGKMTAREAARALGVAPKTYHEWEKRGLEAMMEGLTNREPGRPSTAPDPEVQRLQRQVKELETQVMLMRETAELRARLLAQAKLSADKKKARIDGRTRAQRHRLAAEASSGLGSPRPGDRDAGQATAAVEPPSKSEPTTGDAARSSEGESGAADPGAGSQ